MTRCPLCAGTGELCNDADETVVHELRAEQRADLRKLIGLLHQCVMEDDRRQRDERKARK